MASLGDGQPPHDGSPSAIGCVHPPARIFAEPIVRDMLRAMGIVTCPRCFAVVRILARDRAWSREG